MDDDQQLLPRSHKIQGHFDTSQRSHPEKIYKILSFAPIFQLSFKI